jgi:simple sugar transport system permease protein
VTPTTHEPQTAARHIEVPPWLLTIGAPVAGGIVGLLIGAVLIALTGADPLVAYRDMWYGAFGGERQVQETILKTTPLLFMGLGLTVAFRARVWNIGGEGQYFIGALLGSVIALSFPGLSQPVLLVAMVLAGAAGGALWALVAGILKVRRGMNEIISTLMLNYIAILFVQYMSRGPLQEPAGYLPESAQFGPAAQLPTFFSSRIHVGVLLALVCVPIVYALLWRTPLGFRLRAVGSRASVARYAGIDINRSILFVLLFSGAFAGIAGIIEVSTLYTRLSGDISGNYGFSGILVALLGRMHPVGVTVASLFFASLFIGAQSMKVVSGLPDALANAIQAIVVLCVLGADALAHRRQV